MALHHHFQPNDRGAAFDPPTMRLYRRPVFTVEAAADSDAQEYVEPGWGRPFPEAFWHPLSLRWGSNGQMTDLKIKVVLGQSAVKVRQRPEEDHCNPGDQILLMEMAPGAGPEDKFNQNWFTGHIGQEAMLIQAMPDAESFTITAYGPELLLSHKVITGKWHPTTTIDNLAMKGDLAAPWQERDDVWEMPGPAILNRNGRGNASDYGFKLATATKAQGGYDASASDKCRVFVAGDRTAGEAASEKWTAYTALRSVVEWVDDYKVISYQRTNWSAIAQLLGSTPIGTVKLTGLSLLQAIRAILMPVGFGFALEPWRDNRSQHRLIVFKLHDPPTFANVNMAPVIDGNVAITAAAGRRAMVQRVDYLRDNHNVKNHIIVMGAPKITERSLQFHNTVATRDLHPVWDTATYDLDDYDSSNLIGFGNWASAAKELEWRQRYTLANGTDYLTYKHVFRSFAWNEDGTLPYILDGTDPRVPTLTNYSFNGISATRAAYRPRPARARVKYADDSSASTSGAFEPPLVELGIVGDSSSWIKVPSGAYTLSKYRCLIHFKVKDLAIWRPWKAVGKKSGADTLHKKYADLNFATALHNTLRGAGNMLSIRLTAGFEMDSAVYYEQKRQLDSSWPFDAKQLIYQPQRFKYRDIEGVVDASELVTIDSGTEIVEGIVSTVPKLKGEMNLYSQRVRDALEDATGHGSVSLRGLHRAYYPGQGLRKLAGRNIDLSLPGRRQNKAASVAPVIVGIAWHFQGGANKTELLLETGQIGLPG